MEKLFSKDLLAEGGLRNIAFAGGIIGILLILFVPLPPILLDLFLAISIAISLLILMVGLSIKKPLDFSSFPTVLLIATMLRLALNIASTRLILSEGHTGSDAAGAVIMGFSQFVMGGNLMIGIIVFAILVTINFVVITKGATRIAEVSARFTLDAIPGKQMAIDADLSAGIIDDMQAKARRKEIQDESSFFGAMDGAAKFVRGDAVAGIIITLINLVGGLVIGMIYHDMAFTVAASNYSTLTVGDGLVSQIPGLIVSLASGILVSRGGTEGSTDTFVVDQFARYPKALALGAAFLAGLAFMPGFPSLIFLGLAAAAGFMAYKTHMTALEKKAAEERAEDRKQKAVEQEKADPYDMLKTDGIRLDVSSQLVPLITGPDATIPGQVTMLRNMFADEYGFILPPIRIKDSDLINDYEYVISVQGTEVARGMVRPNAVLAMRASGDIRLQGEAVKEPVFGMNGVWIDPSLAEEAMQQECMIADPDGVVVTHLTETIKDYMPTLLTFADTQRLIDSLDREYQKLVQDISSGGGASTVMIQRVLQHLLAERVSIKNLALIIESIAEAVTFSKNVMLITEHVRMRLSPQISRSLVAEDGFIPIISLTPEWDALFANAVKEVNGDRQFDLPPSRIQEFMMQARKVIESFGEEEAPPALLVNPDARPFVRAILERFSSSTPVVSPNEIHRKVPIRTVRTIGA